MAEFAVAISIVTLIGTGVKLGTSILNVARGLGPAGKEFEIFSQEVSSFSAMWEAIRPLMEGNHDTRISPELKQELEKISKHATEVLGNCQKSVNSFSDTEKAIDTRYQKQVRKNWGPMARGMRQETHQRDKAKRVKLFFARGDIELNRSRLHFAQWNLTLILTAVKYCFPSQQLYKMSNS